MTTPVVEVIVNQQIMAALQSAPGQLTEEAKRALDKSGEKLLNKFKEYPPRKSDYVRTGNQGQGWKSESGMEGRDIVIRLYNNVWYDVFTQSDNQAWMHEGIWRPVSETAKDSLDELKVDLEKAVDSVARDIAGK